MPVKTDGLDKLADRLAGMAEAAKNTEPLTSKISRSLVEFSKARLKSRTEPDGSPFAPLAASTIERKKYPPSKKGRPLVSTLYGQGQGSKAVYGSNAPYAGFLQKGTPNMPPRPFLLTPEAKRGPAADERAEIKRQIIEHIKGK